MRSGVVGWVEVAGVREVGGGGEAKTEAHAGMTTALDTLRARVADRSVVVGVIGLGYVGLPLAAAFEAAGVRVIGFDTDEEKPKAIREGRSYLSHVGGEVFARLAKSARFEATTDHGRLGEADAVMVCVPTPLGAHQEPDLSYVARAGEAIGACLRGGQVVCLESTTYPGTTRGEFVEALVRGARGAAGPGKKGEGGNAGTDWRARLGADVFVAFSPEREDPGNTAHPTTKVPKLVGGLDAASLDAAAAVYEIAFERVVRVSSAEVAESAKLLENVFRSVNIALVNEMKVVLEALGIDVWEVIEAAGTKPFGFMKFTPGPGLGGHCIPIDPFYLSWRARAAGVSSRFIELAGEVNTRMPERVVRRIADALNGQGKAVKGSGVLVLGLAYKADIDDVRESPALEIIEMLVERGAVVGYHDPLVPRTHRMRRYDLKMSSVALTQDAVKRQDCVVITTAHSAVDYALVANHARLVVDTRNAMRAFRAQMGERLVTA